LPGKRVQVPFGRQKDTGYIVGVQGNADGPPEGDIRDIIEVLDDEPVVNQEMLSLSSWMASYYLCPWGTVLKTILPGVSGKSISSKRKRSGRPIPKGKSEVTMVDPVLPVLNQEQKVCLDTILTSFRNQTLSPLLLHGVTGSGKTEIYLRIVEEVRKKGLASIVLVPEISLTSQIVTRFRDRFSDRVAVFHSGLSDGERREAWLQAQKESVDIVVGTRSAVFFPFTRLGLVVVDEEHDPSYKQEEGLRYHARDVAIYRARACGATVVLGSATPSLESFFHADSGKYRYIQLRHRIDHRPLPEVRIVDLRSPSPKMTSSSASSAETVFLSPLLQDALRDRLDRGEQSLLFLNRRGFFPFLLCEDCGQSPTCPNCSLALSYHKSEHQLRCHACDYKIPPLGSCPKCQGIRIKALGIGTERVETEIRSLFPEARVLRMDRDTTRRKNAHGRILDQMQDKKADILIGTQMITKGLDFPDLTLVGVLLADTGLHLPDFRAGERSCQLISQVAGRAGRGRRPGEVIIQTYNPEHPAVRYAATHDYTGFSKEELSLRKSLSFPPYRRLARLLFVGNQAERVEASSREFCVILKSLQTSSEEILGPAPAPLLKLRGKFRWQLLMKYKSSARAHAILQKGLEKYRARPACGVRIEVDIDPQSLQ
ncbi:MAG: primosomal protein N', partial [Nitrospirae bacterium]|nr:primosomal protein N' [Nitrospirota bacterium]